MRRGKCGKSGPHGEDGRQFERGPHGQYGSLVSRIAHSPRPASLARVAALIRFLLWRKTESVRKYFAPLHSSASRVCGWAIRRGHELAFLGISVLRPSSTQLTSGEVSLANGRNRDAVLHVMRGQLMFLWVGPPNATDT